MDEAAVSFMLSGEEVESLDMTCRGGEACCGRESHRQCGEGEGDCDEDADCAAGLFCAHTSSPDWCKIGNSGDCCTRIPEKESPSIKGTLYINFISAV